MSGSKPSPGRWQSVAELTSQGLSAVAIASILGVSSRTVVRDRRNAGVAQGAHGKTEMSPRELARAVEMLEDGCSLAEVARTLGRSHATLLRRFPGWVWTAKQIADRASLSRLEKRLLDL